MSTKMKFTCSGESHIAIRRRRFEEHEEVEEMMKAAVEYVESINKSRRTLRNNRFWKQPVSIMDPKTIELEVIWVDAENV